MKLRFILFRKSSKTANKVERLKRSHRGTVRNSQASLAEAQKVLTNGFAIKVYNSRKGSHGIH